MAADFVASPADGSQYWSGFYVGVNGGYSYGSIGLETSTATAALDGIDRSFSATGWLLGGTAGYNIEMNGIVAGVEGDIDWAHLTGSAEPISAGGAGAVATGNIDWLGTARARLGITAGDSMMVYVTAGVAGGGISGDVTNFPHDGMSKSTSGTQVGWTAGAGVEAALTENVTVKAEYLYVDLGSKDYDLGIDASDVNDLTASVHPVANLFRLGMNYKF